MSHPNWTHKGETLSHKNAYKEYGLEEHELINAMTSGKLQYKENYAHGNPYYRLLREEAIALTIELRGKHYFKKQELEHKIKIATREINSCRRKMKKFEKEKEQLINQLDHLEK